MAILTGTWNEAVLWLVSPLYPALACLTFLSLDGEELGSWLFVHGGHHCPTITGEVKYSGL